jgi:hypothetical protein
VLGRASPVEQPRQSWQKVVGDGAAEAAISKLHDIAFAAVGITAAEQQFAIDPQFTEFVDYDSEPPSIGMCQQMPHETCLARA